MTLQSYIAGFLKEAKYEGRNKYKALEKNRVPLTPEERSLVMKRKAVWHHGHVIPGTGGQREPSPAVWKSVSKDGKAQYITATHRAYNVRPTIEGAISRYHRFIRSTA